ncbi:MAG: cytochrome c [Sedimenticola sp.]
MRLSIIISVCCLSLLGATSVASEEKALTLPPQSIAEWYKPLNERQVWLHTMFGLRREMQAVSEYTQLKDRKLLAKWSGKLAAHYRKISEMVPEWEDELNLAALNSLEAAVAAGDFPGVMKAQRKLGQSCKSCHREYRAVTAALYRTPDFSRQVIANRRSGEKQAYGDAMKGMSVLVNRIKISMDDGRTGTAIEILYDFGDRLGDLANSCVSCHEDEGAVERVLGDAAKKSLVELAEGVHKENPKGAGRALGAIAVQVCATCHSVHRTGYDLTRFISH